MSNDSISSINVNTISKNNPKGCKLEVDLEYPKELHSFQNNYPLASARVEVKESVLLAYCKDFE